MRDSICGTSRFNTSVDLLVMLIFAQLRPPGTLRSRVLGSVCRMFVGAYAHGCVEFDFRVLGDGRSASARYANNSNYRNDSLIRKESKKNQVERRVFLTAAVCVSDALVAEIKRIVKESEILKYV
jgi:hypothetical protein